MSSTNKTSLGLNMWEASDKPVRQDFVNDNVIIDEKITKLNSDLNNTNIALDSKQTLRITNLGTGNPVSQISFGYFFNGGKIYINVYIDSVLYGQIQPVP
ncbi:hypothetical protein [Lacrimispora sp.]|uniref:hypothetical protein n=1 Tax=Lacrimispora sp. TaxID=2719234 RepID=UPI0028A98915|nr:hypothetical protein [Lacrimispora sp.]